VLDCAIASGRPVPDGRRISWLADDLADGRPAVSGPAPAICRDLLELLAAVSDGRPGQGRDHPVAAVLALAAAAEVAGSRSFTAIAGWAADVPAEVMEELYRRCGAVRPGAGPPSKATIWRVVTGADTAALDAVTGTWLMEWAGAAGDLAGAGHGGGGEAALIPVRVFQDRATQPRWECWVLGEDLRVATAGWLAGLSSSSLRGVSSGVVGAGQAPGQPAILTAGRQMPGGYTFPRQAPILLGAMGRQVMAWTL
jgi:DDE_Tnp_1-associated